jgi:hypothetical protein
MRSQILSVLLISVLLSSCASKSTLTLNDTIVKANEELRAASEIFNKDFEAVTNNNYTSLEPGRKKMVSLIDDKLKEVNNLKADMPGGEDFKNAFIEYYKFEKDIYDTDYKELCLLTGDGDQGKLNEIVKQMQLKGDKEDAMEKSIHSEQQKFAQKNNLKLK